LFDTDTGAFFVPLHPDSFRKSKFVLNTIEIPIEIRCRLKTKKKPVKIAAGMRGGFKVGATTKLYDDNDAGERKVTKVKRFNDVRPIKLGPTFRVGYGAWNLFGYYNLLGIFKDNQGLDVRQYSIGLSINMF
jgi:hypothetical protein